MTDPTTRNRLDEEASPYLHAHADNPVNWQPWDRDAREAARERDVPIFLSVGYAACHWCHVMAEESFEDESVAEVLNEHFVPVKVDREERPDVDRIYQTICQRVTGQGGWPLSVWLTPEGEPFHVGTYFPKESARGRPGFEGLLTDIHESWSDPDQRAELETRAEKWTRAIEGQLEEVPDQSSESLDADVLEQAADATVRASDREYGGWGQGQKFPHAGRLHVCMRAHARTGDDACRAVVEETLDAMASGGLYDHVGGGFHRYTTDREWVVPHFEKMLYDNAEIPRAFLAGYRLTGRQRYADVARETFEFLQRELQHPEGGFFSTLDARSKPPDANDGGDSEHEEGRFYVWTPAEIRETVDDDLDADLFCDRFGVTERGNFEGDSTVLTVSASIDSLASEYDMHSETVRKRLDRARDQVFDARTDRPRPPRDEKVLAGWNGLAISALAEGSLVLGEGYAAVAADALAFCRQHLWDADETTLHRRYKDGETKIDGYLADYAFLGRGAFDLYQATGDPDHLAFALELARAIEAKFWDSSEGTLYFTPANGESLIARPSEIVDQSTPASTGVAAAFLLSLSPFVPHDRFETITEQVVETHSSEMRANPLQHASLTLAADSYATGHLELTLVADETPEEWTNALTSEFVPAHLLAPRPANESDLTGWLETLGLDETPPIWRDRGARNGEPTVYACRSFTCSPPKHDLTEALAWADENVTGDTSER